MRGSIGRVALWMAEVCLVAILVGCSEQPVGAAIADAPRHAWSGEEPIEVVYDNRDTLSICDLFVVARADGDNRQPWLNLEVACQSPKGAMWSGNVTLIPSESHRGGSFVEYSSRWIAGAQLMHQGEYKFTLTPTEEYRGVWNVGIALKEQQ